MLIEESASTFVRFLVNRTLLLCYSRCYSAAERPEGWAATRLHARELGCLRLGLPIFFRSEVERVFTVTLFSSTVRVFILKLIGPQWESFGEIDLFFLSLVFLNPRDDR